MALVEEVAMRVCSLILFVVAWAVPAHAQQRAERSLDRASEERSGGDYPRFTASLGVGTAYGIAGFDLGFDFAHFAPFVGLGYSAFLHGWVGGVRFFPTDKDRGLLFVLSGGVLAGIDDSDVPYLYGGGVTFGYRWGSATGWFGEAGAGVFLGASHFRYQPAKFGIAPDVNFAVGHAL